MACGIVALTCNRGTGERPDTGAISFGAEEVEGWAGQAAAGGEDVMSLKTRR